MKSEFEYAMESLDNIAKNLAIGCQQGISNEIWNVMEQAKAAYYQKYPSANCDICGDCHAGKVPLSCETGDGE